MSHFDKTTGTKCCCKICTDSRYYPQKRATVGYEDPLDQRIVWSLDSEGVITVRIGKSNFTAPPWIAEVIRKRTGYDR